MLVLLSYSRITVEEKRHDSRTHNSGGVPISSAPIDNGVNICDILKGNSRKRGIMMRKILLTCLALSVMISMQSTPSMAQSTKPKGQCSQAGKIANFKNTIFKCLYTGENDSAGNPAAEWFPYGKRTAMSDAYIKCGLAKSRADVNSKELEMMNVGHPFLDRQGGDSTSRLRCALKRLKAPTYLWRQIEGTRPIDGYQKESWTGYRADWIYNPVNEYGVGGENWGGLDITITKTK